MTLNVKKSKKKHKHLPTKLFRGENSVKDVVLDFSENTTSHGIPRIGKAKTIKATLFWALIFFLCLALFIWQACVIVGRYRKYEKITQIELQFKKAPFPAVTLCNLNPYKRSLAKGIDGLADIITAFEKRQSTMQPKIPVDFFDDKPVRRKRSPKKYSYRYTPVYSHCYCPYYTEPKECVPFPMSVPPNNDSQCICFYDRFRKSPWPCYLMSYWSIRWCDVQCNITGKCSPATLAVLPRNESNEDIYDNFMPCICQNITNYCIATSDKSFDKLWNGTLTTTRTTRATTTAQPTTTAFQAFESNAKDVGTVSSQSQSSMAFVTANLPENIVSNISYTLDEFILHCSFNQRDCDMDLDFKKYLDPKYGNCYIFNADSTQNRTSQRAGPMYGLSMVLYVDGNDYLPMTPGKGVRINIHPQLEYPFPDTFGYNAPPGFLTSFGVRLKQVERIPWPYDDCIYNGTNDDFIFSQYQYSTEGCYRSCLQKLLFMECGCSDPMFPKYQNSTHCKPENQSARDCLERTKNEMGGLHGDFADDCSCQQPCKQTVYDITFSAAKWPHTNSISNYQDICANTTEDCETHLSNHAVYLEIYYEQLNYELLKESPAYMLANLLADFGGQLGLWMGFSVITCIEFLVLFWDLAKLSCFWIKKEQKRRRRSADNNRNGDMYDNTTVDLTLKVRRNALADISNDDDEEDEDETDKKRFI